MKYNETGNFTKRQKQLAKLIEDSIRELNQLGSYICVDNNGVLSVYLKEDIKHLSEYLYSLETDANHPLKYINAGSIDAMKSETFCFKQGYITEE